MPVYDYACTTCRRTTEVVHSIAAPGPKFCPECGAEGTMRKAFAAPAVHFKGSGWAKKDRTATSSRDRATPVTEGGGEGGTKPSGESETKRSDEGTKPSGESGTKRSDEGTKPSGEDGAKPSGDGAAMSSGGTSGKAADTSSARREASAPGEKAHSSGSGPG